jgi:hypothetical protein
MHLFGPGRGAEPHIQNEEDEFARNSLLQGWKDIVISVDNVFFDVCEELEKLHIKVYQDERTLQLWYTSMPKNAQFSKVVGWGQISPEVCLELRRNATENAGFAVLHHVFPILQRVPRKFQA